MKSVNQGLPNQIATMNRGKPIAAVMILCRSIRISQAIYFKTLGVTIAFKSLAIYYINIRYLLVGEYYC